jgi:cytochrome b subunit of formate dehydrogenase
VVIDEPQKYMANTDIFQLPPAFYPAIIESIYFKDTGKMVELEVVAANRNDYEWMKELRAKVVGQGKHITFRCFNGDIISINKCKLILCLLTITFFS